MRKAGFIRLAAILAGLSLLEGACQFGYINRFVMIPPSEILTTLVKELASGSLNSDIATTMTSVVTAAVLAIVSGLAIGIMIHGSSRARQVMGPFFASYYAVPIWVFYPLLIILFGLDNDIPKTLIAYLYAVVAMIMATIDGLDHVPRILNKLSRTLNLNRRRTITQIVLPSAAPHLMSGIKLAMAYSFIGVIGSEFILSGRGLGYRISYAFDDFDNEMLYACVFLVILVAAVANGFLHYWQNNMLQKRGLL